MFTQAYLLIVNHGHSYIDYSMIASCASGSTWKCLLSCQVLPFGCMRQTTSLRGRQTDETRGQRNRIFEGWACYNAVAYWLQTKQTNKSKQTLAH